MRLIKDGHIINSTQKAYEVIYKDKGYKPYEEDEELDIVYDDITKAEISELLTDAGIEHNIKDNKQVLFGLLGSE